MDYLKIMDSARALVGERGKNYGDIEQAYTRAAVVASTLLNFPVTPYMIVKIMQCVKQARQAASPAHFDSGVDSINYEAFAIFFANRPIAPELRAVHQALRPAPTIVTTAGAPGVQTFQALHTQPENTARETTGNGFTDLDMAELESRLKLHIPSMSNE